MSPVFFNWQFSLRILKIKLKKSIYINLFFTFTIGLLGFVVNKNFSSNLGMETLGLMRLFIQLVAYLNIVELGIAAASTYALYKPIEKGNINKINIIISTVDSFYKNVAYIILFVGFASSYFVVKIAGETSYGNLAYLFWAGYVINTAVSYSFAKFIILFTAHQEYGVVRFIGGFAQSLSMVLQIVILIFTQSFILFILMITIQNIATYFFYKRHFNKNYSNIKMVKDRDFSIIKNMKNLFWHKIGALIVFNTDYILLAIYTSLNVIAVYSTHLIIYTTIATFCGILTPVLTPKIGKFIASNAKNDIYDLWSRLHLLYVVIATVVVTTTYYLLNPFVGLWMGADYLLPEKTIFLILINLFIFIVRSMIDAFKLNSGFYGDIYHPILECIVNLVISIYLVQKIGLDGVLIGTVISNITIVYISIPLMVFIRCFDKRIKDFIYIYTKYLFLICISIFMSDIVINYFGFNLNISSWGLWVVKSIIITATVSIIVSVTFLLDSVYRKELFLFYKRKLVF